MKSPREEATAGQTVTPVFGWPGCLSFWSGDQRGGEARLARGGEHGWAPGAWDWPPLCPDKTEDSAKSNVGGGCDWCFGLPPWAPILSAAGCGPATWKFFSCEDSLYHLAGEELSWEREGGWPGGLQLPSLRRLAPTRGSWRSAHEGDLGQAGRLCPLQETSLGLDEKR